MSVRNLSCFAVREEMVKTLRGRGFCDLFVLLVRAFCITFCFFLLLLLFLSVRLVFLRIRSSSFLTPYNRRVDPTAAPTKHNQPVSSQTTVIKGNSRHHNSYLLLPPRLAVLHLDLDALAALPSVTPRGEHAGHEGGRAYEPGVGGGGVYEVWRQGGRGVGEVDVQGEGGGAEGGGGEGRWLGGASVRGREEGVEGGGDEERMYLGTAFISPGFGFARARLCRWCLCRRRACYFRRARRRRVCCCVVCRAFLGT